MAGIVDILTTLGQAMPEQRPNLGSYQSSPVQSRPLSEYGSGHSPFTQQPQIDLQKVIAGLFSPQYSYEKPANFTQTGQVKQDPSAFIKSDPEWNTALTELKKNYPRLSDTELYDVIFKESSYNPQAINKTSGASGLFQFMPDTAKSLGYTTAQIRAMTPSEQLKVYGEYMAQNKFNENTMPLALLQAAPSKLSNWDKMTGDSVIYKKGSKAWKSNPGWRSDKNGDITVESLMRFYGKAWKPPAKSTNKFVVYPFG